MSAEYAVLLQRIEELENDTRFLPYIGALRKEIADMNKEWYAEIRKGNIPGHSIVHKFGRNDAIPNGTWAFITNLGQTGHVLSAATTVRVKAGNAADDTAGAGAREVTVQGIVATTFLEEEEAITTAGVSASTATSKSFWRIHRSWVSAAGTYGDANTAAVVIENGAGGTDIHTIAIEEGQSQDAVWTVPLGFKGYLLGVYVTVDANKSADVRVFTRADIDVTSAPVKSKRLKKYFDGILGPHTYKPVAANSMIPAKGDIWVEARGSGATTEVSADIEILLVEDGY